jgi:hypothetical protein
LGLIGFVLGSFFVRIPVFGVKTRKIGFVLHKNLFSSTQISQIALAFGGNGNGDPSEIRGAK